MTDPRRGTSVSMLTYGARERRTAQLLCGAFAVFAALAAIFGQSLGPDYAAFIPIVAIVWSLCDLLTAFFLFLICFGSKRPALAIIGGGYLFTGLLTWPYLIAYLANVSAAGAPVGDQQVPATLYLIWHIAFALFVVAAYRFERHGPRLAGVAQLKWVIPAAFGLTVIGALAVASFVHFRRAALPIFIVHGVFQPAYWGFGIPLVIVASAAGCAILLLHKRERNGLTMWLTVALFTSLLDALLNIASPIRFSYAWDAGKLITAATSIVLMLYLLIENARLHLKTSDELDARTNRGAARMRALWQIVTSESVDEKTYVQMVLDVATAHIRSGRGVLGVIGHIEDGKVIVDAQSCEGATQALTAASAAYLPGNTFAASSDVHELIDSRSQTSYWHGVEELRDRRSAATGLRSVIGAPIYVGNQTHFITFSLADELHEEPFIESDIAFVDVVASNISHRFHQRSQLERLQYNIEHDSLTSLYNRTQFLRFGRLSAASGTLFGIITINLDSFQRVNTRAGQMVGDELLVEIAATLRRVDERDIVARLSGDDFAVILRAVDSGETLEERLFRYSEAFRRPFHTGDRDGKVFLDVTASLGAAQFAYGTQTFDDVVTNANVALDASKQAGGSTGTAFGPELENVALERALEHTELRAALRNSEFVLEYQPKFAMSSRTIVGAEALIRWQHPTRGRLPPAAFLGSIKRANMFPEVTAWVLKRIARDLKEPRLPKEIRFFLNVPAHVLDSDSFFRQLEEVLDADSTLAGRLGIEITESEVMNSVERTIAALQSVRRLGLRVAIDDFGTGHSSLSYLKRLPIDIVKLDKAFIDGLPGDENDIALAKMFLSLTEQFGFDSVAEGIENEQQAAWLQSHGCMIAQGFYFSKPLPFEEFLSLVGEKNALGRRNRMARTA